MKDRDSRTIYTVTFLNDDGSEDLFARYDSPSVANEYAKKKAMTSLKRQGRKVLVNRQNQYRDSGGIWINDDADTLNVVDA